MVSVVVCLFSLMLFVCGVMLNCMLLVMIIIGNNEVMII